jgi:photosystem II stability/assembly factor-like uncharacterized protein
MKRGLLLLALMPALLPAQDKASAFTTASLLANLPARELGPTTMGGRVTSIAVYEKAPRIFFIGAASGGVWKTENGGMTFSPLFQHQSVASIGAIAVNQNDPKNIWVATGEGTNRNSVSWGDGIYESTDGGQSWANKGLGNCFSFSKVVIDGRDKNTVYAAALGQTWGANPDRGVYKTTDDGKTWRKILYVDDLTGVADMVMNPRNNKELIVAMWQHIRYPYNFVSGGPGSGIYRTRDGGASWQQLHRGLPKTTTGRVGLSYFYSDPKVIVATVEAADANTGLYKSKDGGDSWAKISGLNPRPFYFSNPRQDPQDINRIYVPSVGISFTTNQGKNFETLNTSVHVDHHAMWIEPTDNNHILIGEDGGVAQSRDRGVTWEHLNFMRIGQYYAVAYDMRKPYWVYGGLQDNGSWAGPTQTSHGGVSWFDFYNIGGGDGFHVQVDPNDWTTVYSESQGGDIERIDQKYGGSKGIVPRAPKGEKYRENWSTPFILSPWNSRTIYFGANKLLKSVDRGDHWTAISPDLTHNNPAWQKPGTGSVSPEDTGAEAYDTIITISESPVKQGLIWVGTDDGLVKLTLDDGAHWMDLTPNVKGLPDNTWVSRVTASRFEEGRAYATFDGHRNNDYRTYVYVTEDYGKTWKMLNSNLPANEPCYVIKEGLKNPDLLFLGTEFGLWISMDRGSNWTKYRNGDWPTVAVHDLEIHPREEDLIIATHGRSLWILPIGALDELTADNLKKDVYFAKPNNIYMFGRTGAIDDQGDRAWSSPNTQPGTLFCYFLKKTPSGGVKISITDPAGLKSVTDLDGTTLQGLNAVTWRGRRLQPGDYRVTLKVGGKEYTNNLHVEDVTDQIGASIPRALPGFSQETRFQADPDGPQRDVAKESNLEKDHDRESEGNP